MIPSSSRSQLATLTALTGVLLIGASVLRLGFLANFISTPVLTGFKAGIGLVIVLDQVPKLVGIHITKQGFFHDIAKPGAARAGGVADHGRRLPPRRWSPCWWPNG